MHTLRVSIIVVYVSASRYSAIILKYFHKKITGYT